MDNNLTNGTVVEYTYGEEGNDHLKDFNGEKCEYDALGNPTLYRDKAMQWSHVRNLKSIGSNVFFDYNAAGIRTQKQVYDMQTKYYYADNRLLAEKRLSSTSDLSLGDYIYDSEIYYTYTDKTDISYMYNANELTSFTIEKNGQNTTYYYRKNLMGDITHIYAKDETGTPILKAEYAYDAWGKCKIEFNDADNIANINPFRYRGYYYDLETGLYYLQSRYYDPETGRFINADVIAIFDEAKEFINGLNLFAYCSNNPVNMIDSTGTSPTWLSWLWAGLQTVAGIALCFIPGAQVFGVGLIVSGVSSLASNTMSAMGLDSKLAMQIQSALNVVGGIGLSFVPGLGALGASMIGAGVLSFAGGYISEALGGSYGLGWGIGNIVGSFAGGMVYKEIINKLNTPSNMMKSFQNHHNRWKLVGSKIDPSRSYPGGISNYSNYRNIWTNGKLGIHTITRNGRILHGPHYHPWF